MATAPSPTVASSVEADIVALLRENAGSHIKLQDQLTFMKKIGEGAFAIVELHQAQAISLARQPRSLAEAHQDTLLVAVKQYKSHVLQDENMCRFLLNEAKLLHKLDHPHIIRALGIGCQDDSSPQSLASTFFLIEEYAPGKHLRTLVTRAMIKMGTLVYSKRDAVRWATQLASALAYLHNLTPMIIHRDVKLENILLTSEVAHQADVMLADFGLAVQLPGAAIQESGSQHGHNAKRSDKEGSWTRALGVGPDGNKGGSLRGGRALMDVFTDSMRLFGSKNNHGDGKDQDGSHRHIHHAITGPAGLHNSKTRTPDVSNNPETAKRSSSTPALDVHPVMRPHGSWGAIELEGSSGGGAGSQHDTGRVVAKVSSVHDDTSASKTATVTGTGMQEPLLGACDGVHLRVSSETPDQSTHPTTTTTTTTTTTATTTATTTTATTAMNTAACPSTSMLTRLQFVTLPVLPTPLDSTHTDPATTSTASTSYHVPMGHSVAPSLPPTIEETVTGSKTTATGQSASLYGLDDHQLDGSMTTGGAEGVTGQGPTGVSTTTQLPAGSSTGNTPGQSQTGTTGGGAGAAGGSAIVAGGSAAGAGSAGGARGEVGAGGLGSGTRFGTVVKRVTSVPHAENGTWHAGTTFASTIKRLSFIPANKLPSRPSASHVMGGDKNQVYNLTRGTGSLMYMAPEVFKGQAYNQKADVFSFAMVLYELLHVQLLLTGVLRTGPQIPEVAVQEYAAAVAAGYRPPLHSKLPVPLTNLLTRCWAANPLERPSMNQIVTTLREYVTNHGDELDAWDAETYASCTCCTVM